MLFLFITQKSTTVFKHFDPFIELIESYLNKIISSKINKAIYLKIFSAILTIIIKDRNNLNTQQYRNYLIDSDIQR